MTEFFDHVFAAYPELYRFCVTILMAWRAIIVTSIEILRELARRWHGRQQEVSHGSS